jgi:hypothetical protein
MLLATQFSISEEIVSYYPVSMSATETEAKIRVTLTKSIFLSHLRVHTEQAKTV